MDIHIDIDIHNQIATFIQNDITGNIQEVPGIDYLVASIIQNNSGFYTTYQIIDKYINGKDNTTITPYNNLYNWLIHDINININTATLIAISIHIKITNS